MTRPDHNTTAGCAPVVVAILASLRACDTRPQLRRWVIQTHAVRIGLPEAVLAVVEQERRRQGAIVADRRHRRFVAYRVALLRAQRAQDRAGHQSAALFGRSAIAEPGLFHDLANTRTPRPALAAKVRAYVDAYGAGLA